MKIELDLTTEAVTEVLNALDRKVRSSQRDGAYAHIPDWRRQEILRHTEFLNGIKAHVNNAYLKAKHGSAY